MLAIHVGILHILHTCLLRWYLILLSKASWLRLDTITVLVETRGLLSESSLLWLHLLAKASLLRLQLLLTKLRLTKLLLLTELLL